MLKTRVIPVLLLRHGRMVKGRQFSDYRDVGDSVSAARIYNAQNADELVFLDVEASQEGRRTLIEVIERVSHECFMPLTVGGGVRSVDDVHALLRAGADKVVMTSAAVEHADVFREASRAFGAQCMIMGIDARNDDSMPSGYRVWTRSGREPQTLDVREQVALAQELGAGEIFLNSIDQDGMMCGYDLKLARVARTATTLPVIIAGGAGNFQHLTEGLEAGADAVACASLFHFGDNNPIRARSFLKNAGFPVKIV